MTIQGSKVKYSKYICPILQKCIDDNHINTFIDCCVGGANIIKLINCENKIGIDSNKYLIALYHKMQNENFIFPPFPSREDWDNCKNNNNVEDWYIGLVSIFASYRSRGFSGGYNKLEKNYIGHVNTMKKDLPLIQDINFICQDYSYLTNYSNCVIYIDPPYAGQVKKYDNSNNFNHENFWQLVRTISINNYVFISEMTAPNDFISIWSLNTKRPFQSQNTCTEQLFIYKWGLYDM